MTDTQPPAADKPGMFSRFKANSFTDTMKQNFSLAEGNKGVVFGRVLGIGTGCAFTAHSLKSKTSDGEDRSLLFRLCEMVLGLSLIAGSALAGRTR